jgi:hypothetical protein
MNTKTNVKGVMTAIPCLNVTAEIALQHGGIITTAASTVNKEVVDIEENESWDRQQIHPVCHLQYIGKDTEGLQKM